MKVVKYIYLNRKYIISLPKQLICQPSIHSTLKYNSSEIIIYLIDMEASLLTDVTAYTKGKNEKIKITENEIINRKTQPFNFLI